MFPSKRETGKQDLRNVGQARAHQSQLRQLEMRGIHQVDDRQRRYDQKRHRQLFSSRQNIENLENQKIKK